MSINSDNTQENDLIEKYRFKKGQISAIGTSSYWIKNIKKQKQNPNKQTQQQQTNKQAIVLFDKSQKVMNNSLMDRYIWI